MSALVLDSFAFSSISVYRPTTGANAAFADSLTVVYIVACFVPPFVCFAVRANIGALFHQQIPRWYCFVKKISGRLRLLVRLVDVADVCRSFEKCAALLKSKSHLHQVY